PESIERGETFSITLYFKVLKPITYNWKVFVHIDSGGQRIQGDHDPIDGRCATSTWQPGDYISDTFQVKALSSHPPGTYRAYVGFYRGSPGSWINMKAVGTGVTEDRFPIGNLDVR